MELKLNGVGIYVKDLKVMTGFYQNLFGTEIEWDGKDPYAQFEHEGIRFMFYERNEFQKYLGKLGKEISFPTGINGTFELAIDLPEYTNVDEEFNRVLDFGAKPVVYPRNEPWGMRTSLIADPEGNLIEIGSWSKVSKNSILE